MLTLRVVFTIVTDTATDTSRVLVDGLIEVTADGVIVAVASCAEISSYLSIESEK